jgi:hypothetical protein
MIHDRQLRQLGELARELAKRGVQVGMSDARPAVLVRADPLDAPLYITVTGDAFAWLDACHLANDPAGAADRIAKVVGIRTARKP